MPERAYARVFIFAAAAFGGILLVLGYVGQAYGVKGTYGFEAVWTFAMLPIIDQRISGHRTWSHGLPPTGGRSNLLQRNEPAQPQWIRIEGTKRPQAEGKVALAGGSGQDGGGNGCIVGAVRRSYPVQRAELVPIKITKIGQIEFARAALAHTWRVFTGSAASSKARRMPGIGMSRRGSGKSDRHTDAFESSQSFPRTTPQFTPYGR